MSSGAAVELNTRVMGEGEPLLLLHGLFGAGGNWATLAKRWSGHRQVVLADARNHGASPHVPEHDYPAMVADTLQLLDRLGIARCDLLGHSMGGKTAMLFALKYPERVRRLVVADMAPVGYSHTHAPYIDAMLAVDLASVASRQDVDLALRTAVPEAGLRQFLLTNLVRDADGFRWRLNLPVLRESMSSLIGYDVLGADDRFEGESLFIHGAQSDYVSEAHRTVIRRHFPAARIEALAGAGHWLHAEQPDAFFSAVEQFLA